MESPARRVKFQGIDSEREVQKTARRLRKLREKKKRKMAQEARREDIRYFLYFLETVRDRRRVIREDLTLSALVQVIFPDAEENIRLEKFDEVVRNRKLPKGRKEVRDIQIANLGQFMDRWALLGHYDRELDRFLQFLRVMAGQSTLSDLMVALVDESRGGDVVAARQLAERIESDERVGLIPANSMSEEIQENVRALKITLVRAQAYNYDELAVRTSSSGESSDGEIEEDI